jgi:glycosyltransferase involved in cell wall biosynthesis
MTNQPLVSVCIPARNVSGIINHVLNNLLLQTYTNFEVLIGDHSSTDNTKKICLEHKLNPRVFDVEYQDPPVRNKVRNKLLQEAKGDIVIFIDADVCVSPDFIETHVKIQQSQRTNTIVAGVVYGKNFINDESIQNILSKVDLTNIINSFEFIKNIQLLQDPRLAPTLLGKYDLEHTLYTVVNDEFVPWHMFWGCNLSFKRVELISLGSFDEDFKGWGCEDNEVANRYYNNSSNLVFTTKAWGFHIPHKIDVTGNLLFWQDNVKTLCQKHPCRANEYFKLDGLHGCELNSTIKRTEDAINRALDTKFLYEDNVTYSIIYLNSVKTDYGLPLPTSKLLWLAQNTQEARFAGCNMVFLPFVNLNTCFDDGKNYTLLGTITHFNNQEIDQSTVSVDRLLLLEPHLRTMVLNEMFRVSKTIRFLYGSLSKEPRFNKFLNQLELEIDKLTI